MPVNKDLLDGWIKILLYILGYLAIAISVIMVLTGVHADVVSINAGGDNQIIINPDPSIEGFFFGQPGAVAYTQEGSIFYIPTAVPTNYTAPLNVVNLSDNILTKYLFWGFLVVSLLLLIFIGLITDYEYNKGTITNKARFLIILMAALIVIAFLIIVGSFFYGGQRAMAFEIVIWYNLSVIFILLAFVLEVMRRNKIIKLLTEVSLIIFFACIFFSAGFVGIPLLVQDSSRNLKTAISISIGGLALAIFCIVIDFMTKDR